MEGVLDGMDTLKKEFGEVHGGAISGTAFTGHNYVETRDRALAECERERREKVKEINSSNKIPSALQQLCLDRAPMCVQGRHHDASTQTYTGAHKCEVYEVRVRHPKTNGGKWCYLFGEFSDRMRLVQRTLILKGVLHRTDTSHRLFPGHVGGPIPFTKKSHAATQHP